MTTNVLEQARRILSYVDGTNCPRCSGGEEFRKRKATEMANLLIGAGIDPGEIKDADGHEVLWEPQDPYTNKVFWSWNSCCGKDSFLQQIQVILERKTSVPCVAG